jgi:hypothetical protein
MKTTAWLLIMGVGKWLGYATLRLLSVTRSAAAELRGLLTWPPRSFPSTVS